MAAIRAERDYVVHEDFMKVRFFTHLFYLYLNKLVVRCWLTSLSTNFISGCAQAKWCKEAGIECALQRRLWERVVTCDFATNAYAVYHWGAQPSPCQSKKEIGYLCSGSRTLLSFSDIHNRSEEDCQADHWEKPFENLLILNQLLFASVIIIRYQLPCVLVW